MGLSVIARRQARNTGAGSASSGSVKSVTSAACRKVTARLGLDRRLPGRLERQVKRLRSGLDEAVEGIGLRRHGVPIKRGSLDEE